MTHDLHVICKGCGHELSDEETDEKGDWFCKNCGNDTWLNGSVLTDDQMKLRIEVRLQRQRWKNALVKKLLNAPPSLKELLDGS